MQQKIIKLTSALLVFLMLIANSATLISYAAESIMSDTELENQETTTKEKNVEFDVYYEGGSHSKTLDIDSSDEKLSVKIKVKNAGYLKDIAVDFSDANFIISDDGTELDKVQKFDAENKTIQFSQINSGNEVIKTLNILADKKDEVNANMFNKDNNIKLTATYVNGEGKETAIEKTITIRTGWRTESAEALLNYEITKYIPYSTNGSNKIITQGKITSGVQNSVLPINQTSIEVTAPQINNKYPEAVTVVANSTVATNGDVKGEKFTSNNYSYDETIGKLTITVNNEEANGKISWTKNTLDEYLVTYIYSADVYEAVKDTLVRITYDVNSTLTLYNNGTGIVDVKKSVNGYADQTEKLGDVIDFKTETTTNLNKGYMYTNKITAEENKKETEYSVKYTATIPYVDIIDEITLTQEIDQFVTEEGAENSTTISNNNYSYDKTLKISKTEFDKVLGENGQITISNNAGTALDPITKDTTVENGYIVVDLTSLNTNSITIQTSKPVEEGNISFEILKAISKNVNYSTNQIKNFTTLKTSVIGNAKNVTTDIVNQTIQANIALEEPTQKASITTNKDTLSTIIKNEGVVINVTLENDSVDDLLYENPTITVNLPANIEALDATAEVRFDKELTYADGNIINNSDGTKSIIVKLSGKQTKYNNVVAQGATLVITADITINNLTPTTETQIGVVVENGDANKTVTTSSCPIKYVAPVGVVTTNSATGYNDNNETLFAVSGYNKQAIIKTNSDIQNVTFNMNVINNYENALESIVVLGRTPFKGNKDFATSQDLGSTFDMPMTSYITVEKIEESKVTTYYSTNGEATSDLALATNLWTTLPSDLSSVRSYMIVINDFSLTTGQSFTFNYNATIPANLDYENKVAETYEVFFNNDSVKDKSFAPSIAFTTDSSAKISATLESDAENGGIVQSGDVIKYKLIVQNTGGKEATNLTLSMAVPDNVTYVEKDDNSYDGYTYVSAVTATEEMNTLSLDLGNVAEYSTITKDILLKTTANAKEDITFAATANVANDELSVQTNTLNTTITKTYFYTSVSEETINLDVDGVDTFTISVSSSEDDLTGLIPEEDEYEYTGARSNTVLSFNLPSELTITKLTNNETDITNSISVKDGKASINLGTVGNDTQILNFEIKANNLSDDIYEKRISLNPQITADNVETPETLQNIEITINKPGLEITQTSDLPSNVQIAVGEKYKYTFIIKNISNSFINNIKFVDYLPNNVSYSGMEVKFENGSISNNGKLDENGNLTITIAALEGKATVTIIVNVVANRVENDTIVTNKASISQEKIGEINSNEITSTIKKYVPNYGNGDNNGNGSANVENNTRRIAGLVWFDKDNNGSRDASEKFVEGINVMLLDNRTSDIAVNSNEEKCITTTDATGAYAFTNVKQGRYTIIFLYDSGNYSPTKYKVENVDVNKNSDALEKIIVYEGVSQKAALTEEINLVIDNAYNIDLGLIEDKKFDLKLNKIVKNIIVNTPKSTTTHEYNKDFAKIDFESKYADNTTMVVEYKFIITNEGAIPGYVKKIADYIPTELKFSTDLNKDWYEGKDGAIYNASLSNIAINPGEEKEVTLILTKAMTKESFGLITNTAELFEVSNDYGLEDTDSSPANKDTNEDDISTANIVAGVKTGQVFIYITLIITTIAIVGVGLYLIKREVLK